MNDTGPRLKQFDVTGEWISGMQSALETRGHQFLTDHPDGRGGGDSSPTPLEYVLASVAGCLGGTLTLIAKRLEFQYSAARFDLHGEIDLRGFMGVPGIPAHYKRVWGRVIVQTGEDDTRLKEIESLVEQRCPVYSLLAAAGVKMEIDWVREPGA